MKTKTQELTGAALDWAVAKCEGIDLFETEGWVYMEGTRAVFRPSTDWRQGGPLIERERIAVGFDSWDKEDSALAIWAACKYNCGTEGYGPNPLIAAMRCRVASKLGDEVEIPEELL